MKIAKPLLLVTTPVGVAFGLYEGYRLAGGLVFLMAAMLAVIGVAMASVVMTIRRERREEEARQRKTARKGASEHAPGMNRGTIAWAGGCIAARGLPEVIPMTRMLLINPSLSA